MSVDSASREEALWEKFIAIVNSNPAKKLTTQQTNIIRSSHPAAVVVAGAGSGKTHIMSLRIAWKVFSGEVKPNEVLGLTFTNKAAGELQKRVMKQLRALGVSLAYEQATTLSGADEQAGVSSELSDQDDGVGVHPENFDVTTTQEGGQTELNVRSLHLHKFVAPEVNDSSARRANHSTERESLYWNGVADVAHEYFQSPTIKTYNAFAADLAKSYGIAIGEDPEARLITDAERFQIFQNIVSNWDLPEDGTDPFVDMSVNSVIDDAMSLSDAMINNSVSIARMRQFLDEEDNALDAILSAYKSRRGWWAGSETTAGKGMLSKEKSTIPKRRIVVDVVDKYLHYKKEHSLIEFADQISWANKILSEVPDIGIDLRSQYKLILLDEYQDTSPNQAAMLHAAFNGAHSICAVGDPYQSIFGWRGASSAALDDFARDFGVASEAQYNLSVAFRNSTRILAVANAITAMFRQDVREKCSSTVFTGYPSALSVIEESLTSAKKAKHDLSVTDRPWLNEYENYGSQTLLKHEKLSPRMHPRQGTVLHVHRYTAVDSDAAVVAALKQAFDNHYKEWCDSERDVPYQPPSAAILVRKTKFAEEIIDALQADGLPYENLVGSSILDYPEVHTVRSLLHVAANPARAQYLMYLLHFFAIGSADIAVLRRFASKTNDSRISRGTSIVEALDYLYLHPESSDEFSIAGRERLVNLGMIIARVREDMKLSLSQIVSRAVSYLNLPGLIAARSSDGMRVQNAVDAFIAMAGDYAAQHEGTSVKEFLDWIDAIENKENGNEEASSSDVVDIDVPDIEIEPRRGVVQILTVHKSKGLEWDYVAVPHFVDGDFDIETNPQGTLWNTVVQEFPTPLRSDAHYVPHFSACKFYDHHSQISEEDAAEAASRIYLESKTRTVAYRNSEIRRLAYVAVTRPSTLLIIGTYDFADAKTARSILEQLSVASTEDAVNKAWAKAKHHHLLDGVKYVLGDVYNDIVQSDSRNTVEWSDPLFDVDALTDYLDQYSSTDVGDPLTAVYDTNPVILEAWPTDIDRRLDTQAENRSEGIQYRVDQWNSEAAMFIAELERHGKFEAERIDDYVTASGVVALMADPEKYALEQLRPIPHAPSPSAQLGTRVHQRIAQFFDAQLMLDVDIDYDHAHGTGIDNDLGDPSILTRPLTDISLRQKEDDLYEAFVQSRFAQYTPLAIERPLEVTVDGIPVRCVLDAVFDTSSVERCTPVTIVDWKTGRLPSDKELQERQLQLGLYRLAWHHAHKNDGIELCDISAYFFFLGETDPQKAIIQAGNMDVDQIVMLFREKYAEALRSVETD